MYECPNCAANLRFHIEKQMLFCEACGTTMDPYAFHKAKDAEEKTFYEATIFSCPQCGGELITEEDTVATFCSYCGSSTILDSRISKENTPQYIIPFQKDKEECKKAYQRMLRYAYFVPKEFKDPEHIERFRPIYMPYWIYSLKHDESIQLTLTGKDKQSEKLHATYENLYYDASSSFSDDLSNAIWPYHLRKKKNFTPSFLSGFYADSKDLDHTLYMEEATELVTADTIRRIHKDSRRFRSSSYGWKMKPLEDTFNYKAEKIAYSLFPVWFLSYRKKDRVAYAVMNGQTGKIAGDMPIAVHKYLLCSLLMALPIFLLLNNYWNIQPASLLIVSALLSFICSVISNMQLSYLIIRENKEKDRGFMAKQRAKHIKDKKFSFTIRSRISAVLILIYFCAWPIIITYPSTLLTEIYAENDLLQSLFALFLLSLVLPSTFLLMWGLDRHLNNRRLSWRLKMELFMYGRKKLPYLIKPFAGIGIATLLLYIMPKSEFWYYAGTLVCMVLIGVTLINIIKYHNQLTTHKLPQLNRRGGDENA